MRSYYLIIAIGLMLVFCSSAHAAEYTWPDANDYKYPEYEIKLVRDSIRNIYKSNIANSTEIYLKINFDFNRYKNSVLSTFILEYMFEYVRLQLAVDINKDKTVIDFINSNENSSEYSDTGVKNKLILWTLLQQQFRRPSDISLEEFKLRRIKLLQTIKNNNSSYAALADYLLVNEGEIKWDEYINRHPGTHFAALVAAWKIYNYRLTKEYDKVFKLAFETMKQNENFYTGNTDLFTDIYINGVLEAYKDINDKEQIRKILPLLNVLSEDASSAKKRFTNFINDVSDDDVKIPGF